MDARSGAAIVHFALLLGACGPRQLAAPAPVTPLKPATVHATASASPKAAAPPPVVPTQALPAPKAPRHIEGMLFVPAATFTMGADSGGEMDEHPAHEVTLAAFYLDETEVTNAAYQEAVDAGVCLRPHPRSAEVNGFGPDRRFRGPKQPVSSVNWNQASAYCQWADKRLPTEAEWERAARGDDGRTYAWGDDLPDKTRARFESNVTADVGSHPEGRGPFGHQDLTGNVWEWVADIYNPYAYRSDGRGVGRLPNCAEARAAQDDLRAKQLRGFTGSNPIPTECERVLRGGAFNYGRGGLRASNRVHHPARYRLVMSGFRCAKDAGDA